MSDCDQPHPDDPSIRCIMDGRYPNHMRHWHGYWSAEKNGRVEIEWDNPDFDPPKEMNKSVERQVRASIRTAAKETRTREPSSEPHAYLRREPHDTEVEASDAAYQTSAATRARVYRYILDQTKTELGGATDQEVEAALGIRAQTVTPRRLELVEEGLVVDSGWRRPTPRGRSAIVWAAVSAISS